MKRSQLVIFGGRTILYSLLLWAVLILLGSPGPPRACAQGSDCSDSINNCKKPVKFVSQDNGCYTFACEYGKATQHNIHTKNASDVQTLLQMAKESGN
jgi:hypothetical protein